MQKPGTPKTQGITLIALILVIGAIAAAVFFIRGTSAPEVDPIIVSETVRRDIASAIKRYRDRMGFFPPDVARGWDPGLEQAFPWNPDFGTSAPPTGVFRDDGTDCAHCPANWREVVAERWNGPYLTWPSSTFWGGKYDYNHWPGGAIESGCLLKKGIYLAIQGDYQNEHRVPRTIEERMIERNIDDDACINTEIQMLLRDLN